MSVYIQVTRIRKRSRLPPFQILRCSKNNQKNECWWFGFLGLSKSKTTWLDANIQWIEESFRDLFEMRSFEVLDKFHNSSHGEIITNVDHLPGNMIDVIISSLQRRYSSTYTLTANYSWHNVSIVFSRWQRKKLNRWLIRSRRKAWLLPNVYM